MIQIFFFSLFPHYFYQSATGVYLAALPTPGGIQIAGKTPNDGSYEQHISHMQKKINDTIAKNKELYEINPPVSEINLHCEYISYCLNLLSLLLILSPSFTSMLKCLIFQGSQLQTPYLKNGNCPINFWYFPSPFSVLLFSVSLISVCLYV